MAGHTAAHDCGPPDPAVPTALLADRIRRAGDVAADHGVDLLLVTPGTDLRYLLDTDGASHERLTCLVLPTSGHRAPPALVVPRLEAPGWAGLPLADLGVEVVTWNDGEDPYLLVSDLAGGPTRLAVADAMPAKHVFGLREALPEAAQTLAGPIVTELRMRKDAAEVEQLRAAGAAIYRVHAAWPSASSRAAPRRRSSPTSRRRSSSRATRSPRSSSTAPARTGPARTTTCPTG